MKTAWWFRGLTSLGRLARAARGIERQLTRIADAHEGLSPTGREVVDEPRGPLQVAQAPPADAARTPDQWARIEAVENMLARELGHPPSPEELVRELDGQEWGRDDLTDDQRRRLGL